MALQYDWKRKFHVQIIRKQEEIQGAYSGLDRVEEAMDVDDIMSFNRDGTKGDFSDLLSKIKAKSEEAKTKTEVKPEAEAATATTATTAAS
jgi:hypothetical protein